MKILIGITTFFVSLNFVYAQDDASRTARVLSHEEQAAIDDAQLGNITEMLTNIKPAVDALADYPGERNSSNPDFVHAVAVKNIELTIGDIRQRSPILRGLESQGDLTIAGGLYDMQTGAVEFLDF